jgi:hypothetical protein
MTVRSHQSRQRNLIAKLVYRAFAVGMALLSVVALVGLSGAIIFADLKTPRPAELAEQAIQAATPSKAVEK